MAFRWVYNGGESPEFDEQQQVEAWLSEQLQGLIDKGVDDVTLMNGSEAVYGPMSLHPAS